MSNSSKLLRSSWLLILTGAIVWVNCGFAQTAKTKDASQLGSAPLEIGLFGGVSFFRHTGTTITTNKLVDGGFGGFRVTENFSRYLGLEEFFSYGTNNARFYVAPGTPRETIGLGSRTSTLGLTPVVYFTPSGSRFRPYVRAGAAARWFTPTLSARNIAGNPDNGLNGTGMGGVVFPAFLYGGGIKGNLTPLIGLQFDVLGSVQRNPAYRLPTTPFAPGNLYVPTGAKQLGLEASAGIIFNLFRPKPVAPPPPPTPVLNVSAPELMDKGAVCPGDITAPVELAVTSATGNLPRHYPIYKWTLNGSPVGGNSPKFSFQVPDQPGTYKVAVTVGDDASQSEDKREALPVSKELYSVTVKEHSAPTIRASVSPTELTLGEKASLSVTGTPGTCAGSLTYNCKADEGTISGDPPSQYDSTGVAFDANRDRLQTKNINIVCTVNDSKGGSASTTAPVTVKLAASIKSTRLDDVVFPANNARVNNCGKRLLIEELYPMLTQHPDWDLVLVGHTDAKEKAPKGKKAVTLDRQRVYNVAATLSAGKDTCPKLELSRIKVAFQGSTQTSEPRPAFCGTSTRNKAKERSSSKIQENDPNARNRRVEIYLVPKGAPLPSSVSNLEVLPESSITKLGCPK